MKFMSTGINKSFHQMGLASLATRCGEEMIRQRRKESFDDQYCLEIFRRAMLQRVDQAWVTLQQRFGETVRIWLRSHPSCDLALKRDSEENYVALTFSRFWYAVRDQQLEFPTLYAALSYLHATLNGVIIDLLRTQHRGREVPLPESDSPDEPASGEEIDEGEAIWASMQELLPNARERRLMYLLYYSGLKPRQVIERCPQEFQDIKEIYQLNHNILDRLRRNRDRLRWLLSDEEA
jgi:DNA-directed RNA polymerase specialized sigma24 family protein